MLFDPRRYLELIEREQSNHEMRGVEGPPRANRAKRANPTNAAEPALLYQGASHKPDGNSGMRPLCRAGRANHAKRANPPHPFSTNSTFSTDRALSPDPVALLALLALLRDRGPLSYGAAASVLGWGATRAWRAEAALKAAGRIEHDRFGRAAIPSPENDL